MWRMMNKPFNGKKKQEKKRAEEGAVVAEGLRGNEMDDGFCDGVGGGSFAAEDRNARNRPGTFLRGHTLIGKKKEEKKREIR